LPVDENSLINKELLAQWNFFFSALKPFDNVVVTPLLPNKAEAVGAVFDLINWVIS
jgi:hypothetical protein